MAGRGITSSPVPNTPIDPAAHMIGLHASVLVRDGGHPYRWVSAPWGDACVHATRLRHLDNPGLQARHWSRPASRRTSARSWKETWAAMAGFTQGLYAGKRDVRRWPAASSMKQACSSAAYMTMRGLQELLEAGRISEQVSEDTLRALQDVEAIHPRLTQDDVGFLTKFGILRPDVTYDAGDLLLQDGSKVPADLDDPAALSRIVKEALGARLKGAVAGAWRFLPGQPVGSMDQLKAMPEPERRLFAMEAVS